MNISIKPIAIVRNGFPQIYHLIKSSFELEPYICEGIVGGTYHLTLDLEFVASLIEITV